MRPGSTFRLAPVALLVTALVLGFSLPVAAGPFFSERGSGRQGSFSPASWADVSRHVTYGGQPSRPGWSALMIPQPVPSRGTGIAPRPVLPEGETVPPPASREGTATVLAAEEQRMWELVNQERARAGLPPLQLDLDLVRLARSKSEDMVRLGYFGHFSPTYGSPFAMMERAGIAYRYAGENLAGAPTVEIAHRALMASPGHRANILSPHFTHVGIGVVQGGPYGRMFTQMFVGR